MYTIFGTFAMPIELLRLSHMVSSGVPRESRGRM